MAKNIAYFDILKCVADYCCLSDIVGNFPCIFLSISMENVKFIPNQLI